MNKIISNEVNVRGNSANSVPKPTELQLTGPHDITSLTRRGAKAEYGKERLLFQRGAVGGPFDSKVCDAVPQLQPF